MGAKQKKNKLSTTKETAIDDLDKRSLPSPKKFQLDYRYWKVNCTSNLVATKSWLRRCDGSEEPRWPQLQYLHNDSSKILSTNPYYIKEIINHVFSGRILPPMNAKIPSKFTPISSNQSQVKSDSTYVELSDTGTPALMVYHYYYNRDDKYWITKSTLIKYACDTIDPFDSNKKTMQFTSVINIKEIFYALTLQGSLVVMQEIDSRLTIMAISSNRVVPSGVRSKLFREYLFQSNGEIMLVFLIHQKSGKTVEQVEVFRLGFPDLKWIKVDRLQLHDNNSLFLGDTVYEMSSKRYDGCKENCIYFTTQAGSHNGWWMYDMESGCISMI